MQGYIILIKKQSWSHQKKVWGMLVGGLGQKFSIFFYL